MRTHSALGELIESVKAAGACCGPMDVSEMPPVEMPISPLETVYEVERAAASSLLTVRTDLPIVAEPVESPVAKDPIMSFREKKLSTPNTQIEEISFESRDESRDEVSISDGEDWAPVTPRGPPPMAKESQLQIQLRNAALMREDEIRERLQHEQQKRERQLYEQDRQAHLLSPRSLPATYSTRSAPSPRSQSFVRRGTPRVPSPRPRNDVQEASRLKSSESRDVVKETVLQRIPPELARKHEQGGTRVREGSVKSGTTWTIHEREHSKGRSRQSPRQPQRQSPRHVSNVKRATKSVQSGTTWNLQNAQTQTRPSPRHASSPRAGRSPRIKKIAYLCSPRKKDRHQQQQPQQPRFAEINWKNGGPTAAENPFRKDGETAGNDAPPRSISVDSEQVARGPIRSPINGGSQNAPYAKSGTVETERHVLVTRSPSKGAPKGGSIVSETPSDNDRIIRDGSPLSPTSCESVALSEADQSHVSEISWRTPQGQEVARMRNERAEPEGVYLKDQYEPGPEVEEWEREMKHVLSSPTMGEALSDDSECLRDDRYNRTSQRTKQAQELLRTSRSPGSSRKASMKAGTEYKEL